jgi:hypothetical protein
MAPTINTTKLVATAIATFVSIDRFIIFPFNYGGPPVASVFCASHIASNFAVFKDARRSARFSATRERGQKKGESALTR